MHLYGIESYIAVPLIRRDGTYFGTLCALDPLPTELTDESFDIFSMLAHLIAFELEADEQQRRREAEVRTLEDFIAIAAHDLRQPLTVLSGRLQLLARRARRGAPGAELADGLDGLLLQTQRAIALSDTLLDVARIEAGAFSVDRRQFDLVALARQTMGEAGTVAPDHRFVLEAASTRATVGDERRLGRVLHNLLENAAKYTDPASGPIVLAIESTTTDDGADAVHVTVRDAGHGVPEDQLVRIFDRQYRSPDAMTRGINGSGLGLFIVRRIIEAHGGSVRAENAPGGGLAVSLTLPQCAEADGVTPG